MVLIHIQIAARFQIKVEPTVMREQFQHVIEKADARGNVVASLSIHRQGEPDVGLFRNAFNLGFSQRVTFEVTPASCNTSGSSANSRSLSFADPSVIRTQPSP